jgi:hypothetical protein
MRMLISRAYHHKAKGGRGWCGKVVTGFQVFQGRVSYLLASCLSNAKGCKP